MAISDNCVAFLPMTSATLAELIGGATVTSANASYVSATPGPCWIMDNDSGYINIAGITLTPPFTMLVEVYPSGSGNNKTYCAYNTGSSQYFQVFQNNSFDCYARTRSGGTLADATVGTLTGGSWNKVGGVYASSTSRQAFLSATLGTAETTSCTPTGTDKYLAIGAVWDGGSVGSGSGGFQFRNFAAWTRTLSQAECVTYFTNPSAVLGGGGSGKPTSYYAQQRWNR